VCDNPSELQHKAVNICNLLTKFLKSACYHRLALVLEFCVIVDFCQLKYEDVSFVNIK
jgi:hypothetical protein